MKHLKSQKGNSFVTAIMVLVIGSVIGLTLLTFSINSTKRNEHRENYTQATKFAEDGANHLISYLEKELEEMLPKPVIGSASDNPVMVYEKFYKTDFPKLLNTYSCGKNLEYKKDGELQYSACVKSYEYKVGDRDTYNLVTIHSTGYAEGEEKTLEFKVEFGSKYKDYPSFLDFAVSTHNGVQQTQSDEYNGGTLVLNGGVQIKGNVLADGNVVISKYGYAPVVDKYTDGSNIFSKINRNPWKESTLPQINGTNGNPAQVLINSDKNLYYMDSFKFDQSKPGCKRSPDLIKILNGVVNTLLVVLGPLVPTVDTLGDYYTYYDLVNTDFNESVNDCIFQILPITDFDKKLIKSNPEFSELTQPINVLDVNEFIGQGKNGLSNLSTKTFNHPVLFGQKINGNYKINNRSVILWNSSLTGNYYLENSPNDSINTSITADLVEDLSDLPILGDILNKVLSGLSGILDLLLGPITDITDKLALTKNTTETSGQFYIKPHESALNLKQYSNNYEENVLIDTLVSLLSLENKAIHIDSGILAKGNHTLKGVYYIDGDVKINNTNLYTNAILFVNGNVSIKQSTIHTNNDEGLIIFATGDIIYDYSSESASHIGEEYYNKDKKVINAFLYSNQKIELHGTLSNIHIKGGISANKVVLTGVRGDVEKKAFNNFQFSHPSDSSKESRLIIEHDPKIKEIFKNFVDSNQYGTLRNYHELFIEPTKIKSRKTI